VVLAEDGEVSIPEGECEIECFDENMNPVPCLDPCPVEEPEIEWEEPPPSPGDDPIGYEPLYPEGIPGLIPPLVLTLPNTGTGG
jgi:hypothetical protein